MGLGRVIPREGVRESTKRGARLSGIFGGVYLKRGRSVTGTVRICVRRGFLSLGSLRGCRITIVRLVNRLCRFVIGGRVSAAGVPKNVNSLCGRLYGLRPRILRG